MAEFDHELDWRVALARGVAITGTLAIVAYGVREMFAIVRVANPTVLQDIMVVFFALTLSWIAQSAASAIAGLIPGRRLRLAPAERVRRRPARSFPPLSHAPRPRRA